MNTETVERKKEKKLDRNHWMCRVQKYTFGIDAPTFYMGYCPFFWMTWLAVIAFLPVAIVKNLVRPIDKAYDFVFREPTQKLVAKRKEVKLQKELVQEPPLSIIAEIFRHEDLQGVNWAELVPDTKVFDEVKHDVFFCPSVRSFDVAASYVRFLIANPNFIAENGERAVQEVEARRLARQAAEEREQELARKRHERAERRRKFFNKVARKISICGPLIFKILIPAVIIAAGLFVLSLLGYLMAKVPLIAYVQGFLLVNALAIAFLSGKLFCSAISIWLENRERSGKDSIGDKLGEILEWVFTHIEKSWEWVKDVAFNIIDFTATTVSVSYKQECPMIIWGDETGPIEKRKK